MPPARGSLGKGPPFSSPARQQDRAPPWRVLRRAGLGPGQGFANTTAPTSHRPGPGASPQPGLPVRLRIATVPHLNGVPMKSPLRNTRVCTPITCFLLEKVACAYFAW